MTDINVETEMVNEAITDILYRKCTGEIIMLEWEESHPELYHKAYYSPANGLVDYDMGDLTQVKHINFPVTRDGQWFYNWKELSEYLLANCQYERIPTAQG